MDIACLLKQSLGPPATHENNDTIIGVKKKYRSKLSALLLFFTLLAWGLSKEGPRAGRRAPEKP
jgi:hypothetical protein